VKRHVAFATVIKVSDKISNNVLLKAASLISIWHKIHHYELKLFDFSGQEKVLLA